MSKHSILIADIGGTNARFALAEPSSPFYSQARTVQCAEFEDIYKAVDVYLQAEEIQHLSSLCFAVAGPIIEQTVEFPNSHWKIDALELKQRYGCERAHLINDFEAIAYSLASLGEEDILSIGSSAKPPSASQKSDFTMGVVGPGSGLGIAGLCRRDGQLFPLVTEAGHVGFSPENILQGKVLNYLHQKFDDRISRERLLSGPGLVNIHEALCEIRGHQNPGLLAADIAIAGTQQTDEICTETVDVFFELLGQVAGDVALGLGAYQGIFIAGGICQRYPEQLANSRFRAGFENKGRHSHLMTNLPTWLISHKNPGLLGASVFARA